jgi:hypothetical protein
MSAAIACPMNFLYGDMPIISSLNPMKKIIRILAMIYWNKGIARKLANIRKAIMLPIKMAMPPRVGVVFL